MKTRQLKLMYYKHREAVIILISALCMMLGGLMALDYLIEHYPFICLGGVCLILAVVFFFSRLFKKLNNKEV